MKKNVQKSILWFLLLAGFINLKAQVPSPSLNHFANNCKTLYFNDSTIKFMPKKRYAILSQIVKFGDGDSLDINNYYYQHTYANNGTYNLCYSIKYFDSLSNTIFSDTTCYSLTLNCVRLCNFNKFFGNYEDSTSCKIGKFSFYSHAYSYGYQVFDLWIHYGDGGIDSVKKYPTANFYKKSHTYAVDSNYLVKVYVNFYDTIGKVFCNDSILYYANIDCDKCDLKSSIQVFEDQNDCKKIRIIDNLSPGTYVTYDFGDNSSSSGRNPSHTYSADNTYTITAYVSFHDSSRSKWCYDTSAINVVIDCSKCNLNAMINLAVDSSTTYKALLYNYSTGNITSQKWLFGDGTSSSLKAPTHTYTSFGTFTLKYIAYDSVANCSDTAMITFSIDSLGNIKRGGKSFVLQVIDKTKNNTSIQKIEFKDKLNLYPNPVTNILNIELKGFESQKVRIFDSKGMLVYNFEINHNEIVQIDVSMWSKGLYIIQSNERKSKFIKE